MSCNNYIWGYRQHYRIRDFIKYILQICKIRFTDFVKYDYPFPHRPANLPAAV